MASLVPENNIFEGISEFSEANNVLLMSLMEETQDDDDFFGDDRLVSMIQSLEAAIGDPPFGQTLESGHVDGQDCSTSVGNDFCWTRKEVDEMIPWSPCGDLDMENIDLMEYGVGNSHFCYGVLLEQQHGESYLPQDHNDLVF